MKVRLLNVRHEDVICILFPFTFAGKASAWYFSLPSGSIHNWNMFEEVFLKKYGDDKTPVDLVMDLSHMRLGPKERIKDFNQRFLTLRDKIPMALRPAEEVTIQFCTKALPPTIAMFVKRAKLATLAEVFDETILIEKDRNSLIGNIQNDTDTSLSFIKCTELAGKNPPEKKDASNFDMDNLQRVIKKLADEVIDIKKNNNEPNRNRGYYRPTFRKITLIDLLLLLTKA